MFNLSYTEKCEFKGTIRVKNGVQSLGPITDVNGNRWDINGIFGAAGVQGHQQWVWACPMSSLHPYYYDTSGTAYFGLVSQRWEPYLVENVQDNQ